MRTFLAGPIVGAAVVATAWLVAASLSGGEAPSSPPPRRTGTEPAPAVPAPSRFRGTDVRPLSPPPPAPASPRFAPGEIVLRVGEGYVFGEDHPVPRGDSGAVDLRCLDIPGGAAVLECPHGGALADVPLGAIGIPETSGEAAELLRDAPETLTSGNVTLATRAAAGRCALGILRSGAGETYRLALVATSSEPNVLSRTARLVFAEIPPRPGGGVLAVPVGRDVDDATTVREIREWIEADRRIPGTSFSNFLNGEYVLLRDPPAELVLKERSHLVLDAPLATSIEFNAYSGLVASRGIAATGTVRIRSYTGVAVKGDMAGTIDVRSYAHLHVTGSLTGKVNAGSYATLVVDGDLTGEVVVSSYTTLLLRGRLLGDLRIRDSGSKFWFESWMSRVEAQALGGGGNELHLRLSDAPAGKHDDWKGWRSVAVGEEIWRVLAP